MVEPGHRTGILRLLGEGRLLPSLIVSPVLTAGRTVLVSLPTSLLPFTTRSVQCAHPVRYQRAIITGAIFSHIGVYLPCTSGREVLRIPPADNDLRAEFHHHPHRFE